MNGFEPLRRRIIDYTEAGQWSEVYDGPLEDCESERLKAENAKLVIKLNAEHIVRQNVERENAKLRELVAAMPYCMETRCLECPMCSSFDTSIGGVPECRASWKLRELGVDA